MATEPTRVFDLQERVAGPISGALFRAFSVYSVIFMVFPHYYEINIQGIRLNLARIFGLAMAIIILYSSSIIIRTTRKNHILTFFFLVYFGWSLIANLQNEVDIRSYFLLLDDMLACFVFFFVGSIMTLESAKRIVGFMVLLTGVLSVLAIFEFVTKTNIFSLFADTSTTIGQVAALDYLRNGVLRVKGPFEQPLVLASVLAIWWPFSLLRGPKRPLRPIVAAVIVAAVLLTQSRVAIFAIPAAMVAWVGLKALAGIRKDAFNITVFAFAGLLVVIIGLIAAITLALFGSEAELSSSLTRFDQLLVGLTLLNDHGLFGFGFGNASVALVNQRQIGITIYEQTIDNLFLSTALGSGYPALIALTGFIATGLIQAIRYVTSTNREDRDYFIAVSCSIINGAICFSVLSVHTSLPLMFFIVGLTASRSMVEQSPSDSSAPYFSSRSAGLRRRLAGLDTENN